MDMKRVWALYRVSSEAQLYNEDDIPMQRDACRTFINARKDWVLTNELYERGISGWKNSVDAREELTNIKTGAVKREFDILLVFMSDRLGRLADEIPVMVSFLYHHKVQFWSVTEGEIKAESHQDKLLNYVRFWQSEGESIKTSVRVKEVMQVLNEKGGYVGGKIPYGYELYDTGLKHPKRDKMVKDIRINEIEMEIVRLIFELILEKGYGVHRIADYLNEHKIPSRSNKEWKSSQISKILRNTIYSGYKQFNTGKSKEDKKIQPKREDWAIISETEHRTVLELLSKRKTKDKEEDYYSIPTHSQLMLAGLVFCGYCGAKLSPSYHIKVKVNGERDYWRRYRCSKSKNTSMVDLHKCKMYSANKYEPEVIIQVKQFVNKIRQQEFIGEFENHRKQRIQQLIKLKSKTIQELKENNDALDVLTSEIEKCLMGKSKFTPERISTLIEKKEEEIKLIDKKIKDIEEEIELVRVQIEDVLVYQNDMENWEDKFDKADIQQKKMMLSKIVDKIYFRKDEVEIKIRLMYRETVGREDVVQNENSTRAYSGHIALPFYTDTIIYKYA